jgi:hypothetical protein
LASAIAQRGSAGLRFQKNEVSPVGAAQAPHGSVGRIASLMKWMELISEYFYKLSFAVMFAVLFGAISHHLVSYFVGSSWFLDFDPDTVVQLFTYVGFFAGISAGFRLGKYAYLNRGK